MAILKLSTLQFPSSGFNVNDGATNWIQGDSSKNVGLGTTPTQKFHVNGNIKSTNVFSSNFYGFNSTGTLPSDFGISFSNTQTTFKGFAEVLDPISGISYRTQTWYRAYGLSTCYDVFGTVTFNNSATQAVYIDLSSYVNPSFAWANYVLVQCSGIWVSADTNQSFYTSRICSQSYYYNENASPAGWTSSAVDSPFADNNDSTNFPASNRILPGKYNETGAIIANSTKGGTPKMRLFRRGTSATTGDVYYAFRIFSVSG